MKMKASLSKTKLARGFAKTLNNKLPEKWISTA